MHVCFSEDDGARGGEGLHGWGVLGREVEGEGAGAGCCGEGDEVEVVFEEDRHTK